MWPDAEKTLTLLNGIRDGDADAVNRLLARHREAVRRMIGLRLDPALAARLDASDVVQDVMVEANRRLSDYLENPSMPFHLWLRHLAKDHIIAAHRRHRKAGKRSVDRERAIDRPAFADHSSMNLAAQLVAEGTTPAAEAIRREMTQRFIAALDTLDDDDQEIILIRHFEQLSNQETAAALELSEPAASMRYLRAIRKLRAVLGTDSEKSSER